MRLEHAMAEFGTVLTLVGSACCCIAVFLLAMIVFSFAFRPKRSRGADVKGIAPAPTRGVATQASLTRLEEEPTTRYQPGGPARSTPSVSPARPSVSPAVPPAIPAVMPTNPPPPLARPPAPPAPLPPPVPAASVPPPVPVTTVPATPAPTASTPPAPPPISGPISGPPPFPGGDQRPGGPPPIPKGTRLLQPSPTIAPGSGDESFPPPPRKV